MQLNDITAWFDDYKISERDRNQIMREYSYQIVGEKIAIISNRPERLENPLNFLKAALRGNWKGKSSLAPKTHHSTSETQVELARVDGMMKKKSSIETGEIYLKQLRGHQGHVSN